MLQILWKQRFKLQNVANTVEMAATSSKILQIARETDGTADPKKTNGKESNSKNKSGPFVYIPTITV
jgi:hypothetical protein